MGRVERLAGVVVAKRSAIHPHDGTRLAGLIERRARLAFHPLVLSLGHQDAGVASFGPKRLVRTAFVGISHFHTPLVASHRDRLCKSSFVFA